MWCSLVIVLVALVSTESRAQLPSKEYIRFAGRVVAIESTGQSNPGSPPDTLNPVSVTPNAGAGSTQAFSFTFSKDASGPNLGTVNVLINRVLDGAYACYLAYNQQSDVLHLVSNNGLGTVSFQGGKTASGTLSNSQCTVQVSGSVGSPWVTTLGNNLTINATITFTPPSGPSATPPNAWANYQSNPDKVIYMAARTVGDTASSGWIPMGVWRTSTARLPRVESVIPAGGAGQRETFRVAYERDGSKSFSVLQLLINGSIDGRYACYLGYDPGGNSVQLQNNDNSGSVGYFAFNPDGQGVASSSAGNISNNQCTVYSATRTVSGNIVALILDIGFSNSFKTGLPQGRLVFYGAAVDNGSPPLNSSDWSPVAAWRM